MSLSSSCLIFKKIKRDLSQIFGLRLHVPCPRWTRHARMCKVLLLSLMPRLRKQVFSLNSRDVQCLKTCWFDRRTVILFFLINCPTLKSIPQKTSSVTTSIQAEWPKVGMGWQNLGQKTLQSINWQIWHSPLCIPRYYETIIVMRYSRPPSPYYEHAIF